MEDDDLTQTVRIQVSRKVGTDSRGHSVWTKPVAPVELELVSTVMLQTILASSDQERKERLRLVSELNDGLLARNTTTLEFEVVSTEELEEALKAAGNEETRYRVADVVLEPVNASPVGDSADNEELSLVSTQMLRRVLGQGDDESGEGGSHKPDKHGGFNPYNKS